MNIASKHNMFGILAIVMFMTALSMSISILPKELATDIIRENGPVEVITALGYMVAAGWLFIAGLKRQIHSGVSAGFLVLLLGLRELDFHARFTTMGIFKTRFYVSPDVPVVEKVIVSIIVIALIVSIVKFIRLHYSPFLQSLCRKYPPAIAVALAVGLMVVSKMLDSFSGPLQSIINLVHNDPALCMWVMEEIFEMGIPCLILLAVLQDTSVELHVCSRLKHVSEISA